MYLKSLVLKGFKSFADRSVLTFEPGITVVVGPNGSGKSNISDAVLWVLGELNAKNLRGQAMEDVIFAGSRARRAVSVAEVQLVLDNSDGTLPVDYSEVSIGRRLYRSGEREYLINGAIVRRMDVLDILHDSGLGTGTHSIIAQGHLANILASKPEDRRALIEETAGVLKHKQRKQKSERKLARMDDHLARAQDVIAEVERQLRPLERKAKRALQYREVAEQLEEIDLWLAVDDLRLLQDQWDQALAHEQESTEALAGLRDNITQAEEKAERIQKRLAWETETSQAAAARHKRAQAASDRLDSTVLLLHEKKRNIASYLADARLREQNDARNVFEADRAFDEACAALDAAIAEREVADAAFAHARAHTEEVQANKRSVQAKADDAARRRRESVQELETVRAALAHVHEVLASNRTQEQLISTHEAELDRRLHAADIDYDQALAAATEAAAALEAQRSREAAAHEAQGRALVARDEARTALDAARDAHSQASAQVKGLEELQRARAAQNPLRERVLAQWPKQATPFIDKISVQPEVEQLVEHLLGNDIEDVLIDDDVTAHEAMAALTHISPAKSLSLLPASSMRSALCHGAGQRLIDCLSYDDHAACAVEALLGNVVLCDTFAQAKEAAREGNVAAAREEGIVVFPNGKITLTGSAGDTAAGALATHRALDEARSRLAHTKAVVQDATKTAARAEAHLRDCQTAELAASQDLALAQAAQSSAEIEMKRARAALEALRREADRVAKQRAAASAALSEAEPEAATLDGRVALLEAAVSEAKDDFDRLRDELVPIRAASDTAANNLAEAKLAAATCKEKCDYAVRMKLTRQKACADMRRAIESVRRSIALKEGAAGRIDPLLEVCEALSAAAHARTLQVEDENAASRAAANNLHVTMNEVRAEAKQAHDAFDAVNETLHTTRVAKGKLELQVEAAIHVIIDRCKTPLETALKLPTLDDRAALEDKAFKLRSRISKMGTINPDAAAEYQELKERYDYLHSQVDDMLRARRQLARITAVIDERMQDDFMTTFDTVNENFKTIFEVLFPGGHGSLTLVDPADLEHSGVEVNAQPNGKHITKMSLMSGGEKSLVAMALLFAVYKTRSTPFYILDEVEAALDDTNLRRLMTYLDAIRDTTQFIIITHQRTTMEMADVLYGISMQNDGVTKVMSQRLERALAHAEG